MRLPSWLLGLVAGELLLVSALFGYWVSRLTLFGLIAAPAGLGGWLFIWGDNGPPYDWIDTWSFNIGFSAVLYGLLGDFSGWAVDRTNRK